jgi:hypothetical protein
MAKLAAKRKSDNIRQPYSVSLLAAVSQDQVVATQLVEGSVDASVFESFIFSIMKSIRENPLTEGRKVVLLLDNATIHRHKLVLESAVAMRALVLFNPQYSPFMNPVEKFFNTMKRCMRDLPRDNK